MNALTIGVVLLVVAITGLVFAADIAEAARKILVRYAHPEPDVPAPLNAPAAVAEPRRYLEPNWAAMNAKLRRPGGVL